MKFKLSRQRIFEIWYVLKHEIKEDEKLDKRFDYALNRTLDYLAPEINQLMFARKSGVQRFNEFEEKRKELIGRKDKSEEELRPLLDSLISEYGDALSERQKEIEIYNELLMEEIEIDICQTSFRYLPDSVNNSTTKILRSMIKETDEEIEAIINE